MKWFLCSLKKINKNDKSKNKVKRITKMSLNTGEAPQRELCFEKKKKIKAKN